MYKRHCMFLGSTSPLKLLDLLQRNLVQILVGRRGQTTLAQRVVLENSIKISRLFWSFLQISGTL